MAAPITISLTGLPKTNRKMARFERTLREPKVHEMVKGAASIWDANFGSEGGMVGGWQELSWRTQAIREARGYPGAHPILVQSGALKRAVVTSLLRGPGNAQGTDISMRYSASKLAVRLRATGSKVDNQYGGRAGGYRLPARPFWFVNKQVEDAARGSLWQWLAKELGKL